MSIEQQLPSQFAGMPSMTSSDVFGDLATQSFIRDTMLAQTPEGNPADDHDVRVNVDSDSFGEDHFNDTQTVDPRKKLQGSNVLKYVNPAQGFTADDVAVLLRDTLAEYRAMPVRLDSPTVISTMRIYVPAPVGNIPVPPIQVLSLDVNRYRITIDAYADSGSSTFRLFIGSTPSDALNGSGFRFDSTQSHPIQLFWGSDLYLGADTANTVGGYFNLVIERYR